MAAKLPLGVADAEEPLLDQINDSKRTAADISQREKTRRVQQLRDDRKSLRYVPWLMLLSITVVIVSALQAGSQDGSYRTPSLRKRPLLRRDSSCKNTGSNESDEGYDTLQSTMIEQVNEKESSTLSGEEDEDEEDPDGAQPGSKSSSDSSSPTPTSSSTSTDNNEAAEKETSFSSSSSTTTRDENDESSDAPTNSASIEPEECEDGSGLCCDAQTCSTGDADGGLSVTSCGYEAAIEGYYCAYTCTMEGWSSVLLTDEGQQYASCSRSGGDGDDDEGGEDADNSADLKTEEEEEEEENDRNDELTFANVIITAGLEALADETCTAGSDCTSYSGLTSACTQAQAQGGDDQDGEGDGSGSSTCTYACMDNADSSCSSAAGDGASGTCVVGASQGETPTASCSVSCTSESYTLGTDSTCSSDDKYNGDLRKRTQKRNSKVVMPEPTANSWKHPKWLR